MSLECDNESIAESELSGTNLVSLAAQSGAYDNCSISVTGDTGNETGEIGSLTINPDPDEGYEGSQIGNATADDQGSFSQQVTLAEVDQGEYAVLAVSSEGIAAVSALSVAAPPAVEAQTPNATGTLNATAPLPEGNVTVENQTGVNQTASTEPIVQLEETEAEPGEPLAISGDGFEPNTPVQVFINNIQITNIITNIQGSFNTVVIVPTNVNTGNVEVSVRTEQTSVSENVNIVEPKCRTGVRQRCGSRRCLPPTTRRRWRARRSRCLTQATVKLLNRAIHRWRQSLRRARTLCSTLTSPTLTSSPQNREGGPTPKTAAPG
jgi:hypothetical protein